MQLSDYAENVCVKNLGGANPVECRPRHGGSCPSDMYQCHLPMEEASSAGLSPGLCDDKWKHKKCRRKLIKQKCHKAKVARNCAMTCFGCQGRHGG